MNTLMIVGLSLAAGFPWEIFMALFSAVGRKVAARFDVSTKDTFAEYQPESEAALVGKGLMIGLGRWFVTGGTFFLLATWDPFHSYSTLGLFAAVFGIINFFSFLIPPTLVRWYKNETPSYSPSTTLRGKHRLFDLGLQLVFVATILIVIFACMPVTQYCEYSYIRQATTEVTEKDGVISKAIYPARVLEVQRNGTLWYEIHPYFEEQVYEIQESPDHNRRLKNFSSSGAYNRYDLLQVSWNKSDVATTTGGMNVVNADIPGNVVLTQVASLK